MHRYSYALCVILICLISSVTFAQIAPECAGIQKPADYDEDKQQAFLHNYFSSAFMLTPMGPLTMTGKSTAGISAEAGWIPSLRCSQRLALGGTKTENTNLSPVLPRLRLRSQLPKLGPFDVMLGGGLIPPVPTFLGTVMNLGGEAALAWQSSFGLGVGLRGHLSVARVRADIATKIDPTAKDYDDEFVTTVYGGDIGAQYSMPWESLRWLTLYGAVGYASVHSLMIVGDDLALSQNYKYPWSGATIALGLRALTCGDHCEFVIEGDFAIPIYNTVKAKIGYVW